MARTLTEIWSAALDGDAVAWRELVERYTTLIYTVARRAGLDSIDAEDCAQHTWIKLYRNRQSIKNAQGLPAWLIRTTHRRALYVLSRTARRTELLKEYPEPEAIVLPDEVVEAIEWQVILELAMKELDPRCRTLISLLFNDTEPLTYAQLAKKLDVPMNTLSPLRLRCLKRLRKILDDLGYTLH